MIVRRLIRMKAKRLIEAVNRLVRLSDKSIYYKNNDLQLRFGSQESEFVISTRLDGTVSVSIYFGYEMNFKFYLRKDGTVLMDEGSTANLIEYSGLDQVLILINNVGEALLNFGTESIESGNYEFRPMEDVRAEFDKFRNIDKKEENDKH